MTDFRVDVRDRSGAGIDLAEAAAAARFLLAQLRLHPATRLSVSYVGLDEMARLHIEHMSEPGATDVLSFPMDELRAPAEGESAEPGELGDIVICPDFAAAQAAEAGQPVADELDLLLCHGILHLLGHDHAEPEEHRVMFDLQGQLLSRWREHSGRRA